MTVTVTVFCATGTSGSGWSVRTTVCVPPGVGLSCSASPRPTPARNDDRRAADAGEARAASGGVRGGGRLGLATVTGRSRRRGASRGRKRRRRRSRRRPGTSSGNASSIASSAQRSERSYTRGELLERERLPDAARQLGDDAPRSYASAGRRRCRSSARALERAAALRPLMPRKLESVHRTADHRRAAATFPARAGRPRRGSGRRGRSRAGRARTRAWAWRHLRLPCARGAADPAGQLGAELPLLGVRALEARAELRVVARPRSSSARPRRPPRAARSRAARWRQVSQNWVGNGCRRHRTAPARRRPARRTGSGPRRGGTRAAAVRAGARRSRDRPSAGRG